MAEGYFSRERVLEVVDIGTKCLVEIELAASLQRKRGVSNHLLGEVRRLKHGVGIDGSWAIRAQNPKPLDPMGLAVANGSNDSAWDQPDSHPCEGLFFKGFRFADGEQWSGERGFQQGTSKHVLLTPQPHECYTRPVQQWARKARTALRPPKANELEMAASTLSALA